MGKKKNIQAIEAMKSIRHGVELNSEVNPFKVIERKGPKTGEPFWYADDMRAELGIKDFDAFAKKLELASLACTAYKLGTSTGKGMGVEGHIVADPKKIIETPDGRKFPDTALSKPASFFTIFNDDYLEEIVLLANAFFVQGLSHSGIKDFLRKQATKENKHFQNIVFTQKYGLGYSDFPNAIYKSLFNGLKAKDLCEEMKLKSRQTPLDFFPSSILSAYVSTAKLARNTIAIKDPSRIDADSVLETYEKSGKKVLNAIKIAGGKLPEESIDTTQKSEQLRLF